MTQLSTFYARLPFVARIPFVLAGLAIVATGLVYISAIPDVQLLFAQAGVD